MDSRGDTFDGAAAAYLVASGLALAVDPGRRTQRPVRVDL